MGYRRILGILDGKRALITGAGQGLGHSYAIFMAREGASIVANDIDGPAAAQTVREIETAGGKAIPHTGNIGHWDTAKEAVQLSISTFGSIDVVVNNAGITHEAELKDETEEHLDSLLDICLGPRTRTPRNSSECDISHGPDTHVRAATAWIGAARSAPSRERSTPSSLSL